MTVSPNSIITPQKPCGGSVALGAAANTNLVVPTNTTLLFDPGADGARLTRVEFIATASQVATQVQLYADKSGTKRLIRAKAFPAYTLSTTNDIIPADMGYSDANPLTLDPNEALYVASAVAVTGINARCEGGKYS